MRGRVPSHLLVHFSNARGGQDSAKAEELGARTSIQVPLLSPRVGTEGSRSQEWSQVWNPGTPAWDTGGLTGGFMLH